MTFSLERKVLEEIYLGKVDGGLYDTETLLGKFAENLYKKGYIDGKLSRHGAVIVQGLTSLGKMRLAQLQGTSSR